MHIFEGISQVMMRGAELGSVLFYLAHIGRNVPRFPPLESALVALRRNFPDRLVVATLGDGAYVFNNPAACHWVSQAHGLPVLAIVFNNRMYGAVRNSTLAMYRDGAAARGGGTLLADLSPAPAFEAYAQASGGYGEQVSDPGVLPEALHRAIHAVTVEGRQALLNVICDY